jgi:MPBQ/MSBQ methyltransferase
MTATRSASPGRKLDFGLKFLHQALKLESLHFGLFVDGIPRTLEAVPQAQVAYTKTLVAMVPRGVKTVLDVGCGVGTSARYLKDQGFAVEGLSPDHYHKEVFPEKCGPDVPFHHTGFEPFAPSKTYDCLFFSESPQYIDKDRFWPKCVELLAPDGCVVAADFFQLEPNEEYHMCFLESDFVARAGRAGFTVDERKDITTEVLPNLEISRTLLIDYGQKFYEFAQDAIRHQAPRVYKLIRMLFRRKVKAVESLVYDKLPRRLDPAFFEKTMRYVMYRFVR